MKNNIDATGGEREIGHCSPGMLRAVTAGLEQHWLLREQAGKVKQWLG